MKPLDRNQFVARKLGKLNNQIILDIGCRDQVFKKSLHGDFKYIGIDYDPENDDSEFINHNLENGLPEQLGKIDIINAMDVLEHVENIHDIFSGNKIKCDLCKYTANKSTVLKRLVIIKH